MASLYDPNDHDSGAPMAGNANFWATARGLWENHEAVYATSAPPILTSARVMTGTNVSEAWKRWRLRGNRDLHPMRWRGHLTPSGGTPTVTVSVGTASTTSNVSGTGWLDVDVTPVAAEVQDCLLSMSAGVGVTLTLASAAVRLVPSARVARQASGWIGDDEVTDADDFPVCVEHVDRLERGPLLIARDRPLCVFDIAPKIDTTMGAKNVAEWVGGNTTSTDIMGRGLMPRVDERPRRYVIDAYVARVGSADAAVTIGVGAFRWEVPALGSWQSVEVVLPAEDHDVVASVAADVGTWCQVQGLQIWRM